MRRTTILLSAGLLSLFAASASAEYSESLSNRVGRWMGWGWSEGYHANDECPPCRPHLQAVRPVGVWPAAKTAAPSAASSPWQAFVGNSPEVLPPTSPLLQPDGSIVKPSQRMRPLQQSREPIPAPVPLPKD